MRHFCKVNNYWDYRICPFQAQEAILKEFFLNASSSINSLRKTVCLCLFGISIPIASFPGIVEILVDLALIDLAISSDKRITLDDRVPGAGVNSNKVTIGPCLTFVISPLILKSFRTFASNEVFNSAFFLFFSFYSWNLSFHL